MKHKIADNGFSFAGIFVKSPSWRNQRGSIALVALLMLPVLIGFAGLAIDIGRLYLIRTELQKAADAAVLAGAGCLVPRTECGNVGNTMPDWGTAEKKANDAISALNNKAEVSSLTTGAVTSGYWNLKTSTTLEAKTITTTSDDVPTLQLSLSRAVDKNSGPVKMYFASVLGITSMPVTATSKAAPSSPKNIAGQNQGSSAQLFPLALTSCLFDLYWDGAAPKLDPSTKQPFTFTMGSGSKDPKCPDSAMAVFTSLTANENGAKYINDLIGNTSKTELTTTESIWLQPGEKTSLYDPINNCSAAGNKTCEYVLVPVMSGNLPAEKTTYNPIKAFACIHILKADGKAAKAIFVQMSKDCKVVPPEGKPITPGAINSTYGVITPPSLIL